MEDDKKRSLDYNAEFQYDEDYFSDYTFINTDSNDNDNEIEYDDDFMQGIQDSMDDLTALIPGLPIQLQTAINQVFKPILLDWRENLKDKKYPSRIPDPEKGIIRPIRPDPNPDPEPGPVPPSPSPNPDPTPDPDPNPDPEPDPNPDPEPKPDPDPDPNPQPKPDPNPDPGPNPNPEPNPNPDPNPQPGPTPPNPEPDPEPGDKGPTEYPEDPWYPGILPPGPLPPIKGDDGYPPDDIIKPDIIPLIPGMEPKDYPVNNNPEIDDDDDLFTPATSKKFVYEEVDPVEIVKLEFDKNVLDLYDYYTNGLKKILGDYYTQLLELAGTQLSTSDMDFMLEPITLESADVIEKLRHVMDSALRSEVMSNLKVDFSLSMFSLESSLYHMKNMKVTFELRLRYTESKKVANKDKADSIMNRILDALRTTYDAKYDNAYINWYKYLNSSLEVLADIMRSFLTCLKSKATIIKKGGTKK